LRNETRVTVRGAPHRFLERGETTALANVTRRQFLAIGAGAAFASPLQSVWAAVGEGTIVPFVYHASDGVLADLKRRLDATRWPDKETGTAWDQGPPLVALQSLVDYWRGPYDWRQAEVELNQWPQFKTTIDDLGIHFIHVRSRHPGARPLILTHGWPSSILLFRDVIAPLTDPTAHGGSAADAFDVVIPARLRVLRQAGDSRLER
jgi:hypothetical protein